MTNPESYCPRDLKKPVISYTLNVKGLATGEDNVEQFEQAVQPNTRLIYLESPSSAVFGLQDVRAVSALAREREIGTILDNSWASPVFQKPLEMGVDLEVHSVTKYLAGHSDLVAGAIIGSEERIREISLEEGELLGGKMAPFEAWLLLRSLRTLPLRMKAHETGAMAVLGQIKAPPTEFKSVKDVF